MSATLRQWFLAGLLAVLPIYITFTLLAIGFRALDGVLGPRINALLAHLYGLGWHIPGLGVLGVLAGVAVVGALLRVRLFRAALDALDRALHRVPLVGSVYNASQQVVAPFADDSRLPFSQVVLVEYPMPGRYTIGLVAKERVTADPDDPRCVVFFPSNHLHLGYPVVLDRKELVRIDMTVEEAVKFFVSCGVIGDDALVRSGGRLLDPSEMPGAAAAPRGPRAAS